jgi:ABC-type nitrate/sulfonate/bicarbonate transport system substrate-binding protein
MLATGDYRSIGNIGDVWTEHTRETPMNQGVTMNSDWAAKNPDLARRFNTAFSEALSYLTDHPDAWGPLARSMGLRTAAEADLLRRRVVKELINRWDPAFIDEQRAFYSELLGIVGPVPGMPQRLPDGTFTTAYAPAGGGGS